MSEIATKVAPVDEILPLPQLFLFGLQHVLVMAASPITAAFLVSRALNFSPALTLNLISATFLICGLGTLLQSFGPAGFGARLPFIMVPGGAPIVIFLTIAQQTNLATAAGAVIITAIGYFLILPIFARCLRFFPRLVIGTILILVAVNLVKVYGGIITGQPGSPSFADPTSILLALATIAFTLLFARFLTGLWRQLSVLLGLVLGACVSGALGVMSLAGVETGAIVSVPSLFPFGWPTFDFIAAIPLVVFSVISMAEATGQTIAIADVVGKEIDAERDVPKTIRGDALASLVGGCLGTSLIITSGENIGIVRATGIRSRYVTAAGGVILVGLALLGPARPPRQRHPRFRRRRHGHHRVLRHCGDGRRHPAQGRSRRARQPVHAGGGARHGAASHSRAGALQQVSAKCCARSRQRARGRHAHRSILQHHLPPCRDGAAQERRRPPRKACGPGMKRRCDG